MARSAVELGQWSRALEYIGKGLSRFPESESLRLLEIITRNQDGHPDLALSLLNSLPSSMANRSEFRVERIKSLVLTGRTEEARREIEEQSPPLSAEIRRALRAYLTAK